MPSPYKQTLLIFLTAMACKTSAQAIIDANVMGAFKSVTKARQEKVSLLVFLNKNSDKKTALKMLQAIPNIKVSPLDFMPALRVETSPDANILNRIAQTSAQISLYKPGTIELDKSAQILKLTASDTYSSLNNWWAHGYTGKKAVVGIIDTGIDASHPALSQKKIIIRQEPGSDYSNYIQGVKEPHGTAMACIYASSDSKYLGLAYGASTIVTGLAGSETADTSSLMLTMGTLDWMLTRSGVTPSIINYSMGNGKLACQDCPEWSGLARVIDYVINTKKILWVKSAGNMGYIAPTYSYPFASTLTVPGDNYNGLTVANMDPTVTEGSIKTKVVDRSLHHITKTSSRGPTPFGRRKPDLAAPGHDTRTCAPDPLVYPFEYAPSMDYHDGYRLVGGTSSAAPHVGASILLLQDAGITEPIAIKALLINSADTWADETQGTEGKIIGSAWNRTYGFGYINMDEAFKQRKHIIQDTLSLEHPILEYQTTLKKGEKITLVHERRVGYSKAGIPWRISPLSLELIDLNTNKLLDKDQSPIDTVHQVSNCTRTAPEKTCSDDTYKAGVLVRVSLRSNFIDGATKEPFALACAEEINVGP